jgi:hypothetical protein
MPMSRNQNLDRQCLRAHALFGAASLLAFLALLAVAPAEAAPRKRTPWVDPPGPGQAVIPEAPPATGALPAAASPGPAKAEAAKPAGRTAAASDVASDSPTKAQPATTKAASATSDASAGRKAHKVARSKHVRTAQSRRAKAPTEARASQQQVAEDLQPFDDELTYDEVVRNGVEIDPRTIAGLPHGYRVYSLRSITTVSPVGPPVVVMRQPWPNRAFVPYRRF